jgi:hypothetical protein
MKMATISLDDGMFHDRFVIEGIRQSWIKLPGGHWPGLKALGVTATFYVPSAWWDRAHFHDDPPYIRKCYEEGGQEVGCHTATHVDFDTIPRERWSSEIKDARKRLQDVTGQPIHTFAYPFGWLFPGLDEELELAGFSFARTYTNNATDAASVQNPKAPRILSNSWTSREGGLRAGVNFAPQWLMGMTAPIHPGLTIPGHPKYCGPLLDKYNFVHFVGHGYQLTEGAFWDELFNLIAMLRAAGYEILPNSEFFTRTWNSESV